MTIFQNSFERFKLRLRKNQTQKSAWTVTRWAVHDLSQFEALVDKIKSLVDGLESVTSSLGLLKQQQTLLGEEIESVSDAESLRLLRDATSGRRASAADRSISDRASQWLSLVEGKRSTYSGSAPSIMTSSISFHTAPSQLVANNSVRRIISLRTSSSAMAGPLPDRGIAEIDVISGLKGLEIGRKKDYLQTSEPEPEPDPESQAVERQHGQFIVGIATSAVIPDPTTDVPQNVRIMHELLKQQRSPPPSLSFKSGAHLYGNALSSTLSEDDELWHRKSPSLLSIADTGCQSARRIFLELRSIRRAGIPFISAAPVGDTLDKVLASIEGPPDTPYAGGIFWVSVKFSDQNTGEPPFLRFQTRIYHPNIDCHGNICADYKAWWKDPDLSWFMGTREAEGMAWFSEKKANHFALGAVLTSLCGLLASPNIEDPLVPEIAETYIKDYSAYWAAARSFTQTYATEKRPEVDTIEFEDHDKVSTGSIERASFGKHPDVATASSVITEKLDLLRAGIRKFQEDEAESERNIFLESAPVDTPSPSSPPRIASTDRGPSTVGRASKESLAPPDSPDDGDTHPPTSPSKPGPSTAPRRAENTTPYDKSLWESRNRRESPRGDIKLGRLGRLHPEKIPRRTKPRFSDGWLGDYYSPQWIRGAEGAEEGWCGYCRPGHWIPMELEWRFHLQFVLGIAESTGDYVTCPEEPPRRNFRDSSSWIVYCHICNSDVDFSRDERGGFSWYFHMFKVCVSHTQKRRRRTRASKSRLQLLTRLETSTPAPQSPRSRL